MKMTVMLIMLVVSATLSSADGASPPTHRQPQRNHSHTEEAMHRIPAITVPFSPLSLLSSLVSFDPLVAMLPSSKLYQFSGQRGMLKVESDAVMTTATTTTTRMRTTTTTTTKEMMVIKEKEKIDKQRSSLSEESSSQPMWGVMAADPKLPPGNVTNAYVGQWNLLNGDLYNKTIHDGSFNMELKAVEKVRERYHFVEGEMNINGGHYIHNDKWSLAVNGVYDTERGRLYLYMVPHGWELRRIVGPRTLFNQSDADAAYNAGWNRYRNRKMVEFSKTRVMRHPSHSCIYKAFFIVGDSKENGSDAGLDGYYKDHVLPKLTPVKKISLKGEVLGLTCQTTFSVVQDTFDSIVYAEKVVNFNVAVVVLSIIETAAFLYQMSFTRTQTSMARVSLLTIGSQVVIDANMCIVFLTLCLRLPSFFKAFVTATFFKLLQFTLFGVPYLMELWRARQNNADMPALRRLGQIFLIRIYISILVGMTIFYNLLWFLQPMLIIIFSLWVPQIVRNLTRNARESLHPLFFVTTSICRLMLPLYLYACPYNIFHVQNNLFYCLLLVSWVVIQVLVLLGQYVLGPRKFIPKAFLPPQYEYHKPIPEEALEDGECSCVICMYAVEQEHAMITPCNHVFHEECLLRWMEERMICPTCRKVLPPP